MFLADELSVVFVFFIWFGENFIWEQSDKQQLSSFFSFILTLDKALISLAFYCLFEGGQALVKLLFELPSDRF